MEKRKGYNIEVVDKREKEEVSAISDFQNENYVGFVADQEDYYGKCERSIFLKDDDCHLVQFMPAWFTVWDITEEDDNSSFSKWCEENDFVFVAPIDEYFKCAINIEAIIE